MDFKGILYFISFYHFFLFYFFQTFQEPNIYESKEIHLRIFIILNLYTNSFTFDDIINRPSFMLQLQN